MKTEAGKYDRNNALQVRDAKLLIERIKLEFADYETAWKDKRNLTILDVGCGSGNVTELLYEAFKPGRLIAIDSSQTMIEYAKKHHSKPGIEYYHADCTLSIDSLSKMLQLDQGCVDLALSIYCLHWVSNVDEALRNIRAFLRPNTGKFALITSVWSDLFPVQHRIIDNPVWKSKLKQWIDERSERQTSNKPTTNNSPQITTFGVQNKPELPIVDARWRSLIQRAGLEIDNLTFTNVNYHYSSVEHFHDQVEIVSYWFEIVPETFQDQFRCDYFSLIDREYVKQNTNSMSNTIKFNYTYSIITGTIRQT